MISREVLERKILPDLETKAYSVEFNIKQLLEVTPIYYKNDENYPRILYWYWEIPNDGLRMIQRTALRDYQSWYSSAYQLIKEYFPEKENEFVDCYNGKKPEGILKFIQLKCYLNSDNRQAILSRFYDRFELQRSILLSIPSVIEAKNLGLRKIIAADFIESEIDQADLLFRNGFERAAGAIAGVALEKHLKTQCDINGVQYKHKDTIEPLAQALHSAGKLDDIELKRIIYLGGIRNDCAHPNDISIDQIKALIEQVKKIVI